MERDDNSSSPAFLRRIIELYAARARPRYLNLNSAPRVFAHLAPSILCSLALAAWPLPGQAAGAQFVYDPAGRLIQVIAPDGTSAQYSYDLVGNLLAVTPLSASTAAVTGFSTSTGTAGGTSTIYGSGFSTNPSGNLVYFNGVAATVVSSTTNSLTVVIPSGATTGPVTVTDTNGTAQSAGNYNVLATTNAPTITSVSPNVGPPGSAVTINGTNFPNAPSSTKAYFSSVIGVVTSASPSAVTVTVPTVAPSGPISVATPDGVAVSTADFFISPVGSSVGATARLTIGGAPQTLTISSHGQIGMAIFNAAAGQVVDLTASGATFPGVFPYDTRISVAGPGGLGVIAPGLNVGSHTFAIPMTGTYTAFIYPGDDGYDTGSVTLQLAEAALMAGPIALDGAPVTATTTQAGQSIELTFSIAVPNSVVEIQASADTFPSGCASQSLTIVRADDPSYALASGALCPAQSVTLPVGAYILIISPTASQAGSVTMGLHTVAPVTGTIAIGGSSVTTSTTQPGQRIELTFVSTGTHEAITVLPTGVTFPSQCYNTSFAVTGPAPASTELVRQSLCVTQGVTLPTAGTYTLTIIPYGTDMGSITVQVQDVPTVTAPITIDGSPVTVSTVLPAQQAQLTFATSTINQIVNVGFSNCTFGDCWDAILSVTGPPPANTLLANYPISTTAQLVTLPSIGPYTLTIVPWDTDSGAVTVQLQSAPTISVPISIDGGPITQTTTVPGQAIQFVFSTTSANQTIVVEPLSYTFPNNNYPSLMWTLTGPSLTNTPNDLVASNNLDTGQTATLASAGTYVLTVMPAATDTGGITMQLQTKPAPVAGSISMDGAAITSTTTLPAQDIALTFTSSTPNQRITVQSSTYTFPSDCNASSIEFDDSTGAETASSKPCPGLVGVKLGPNTGPYTLDFSHWLQDTGSLTLQLASVHDVTGTIAIGGAPVTAATTVPLQLIRLTFNISTPNQAFTVKPSGSTFSSCYQAEIFILDSTGTSLPEWYDYLCGGTTGPQLPVGIYTLEIVPFGQATGGVTVQLTSP